MRYLMLMLVMVMVMVGLGYGQEATVVQLSGGDAKRVGEAWGRLQKAKGEWERLRGEIRKGYVETDNPEEGGIGYVMSDGRKCPSYKKGFVGGEFEYSKDFKFIVPSHSQPPTSGSSTLYWSYPYTTTPTGTGTGSFSILPQGSVQ